MKTILLTTTTLAVFSTFAVLTFAGGQERIASFFDHDTALSTTGADQRPATTGAGEVRPIILVAVRGNDPQTAGAGGQRVWLEGSVSGRPWWQQPRQVH
jgi:hypothetical protein